MTTHVSDADLLRVSVLKLLTLESELTAALLAGSPAALAAVDAAHPRAGRTSAPRQKPLAARVTALRAAASKTPPRVQAGTPQSLKPATSAAHFKPAAAAPTSPEISTAQLETLAVGIFGLALPRLGGLNDAQKRAALAVEFWQAHLSIPHLTDRPEVAANNWRPDQLTGVPLTIARLRQQRVNDFLKSIRKP